MIIYVLAGGLSSHFYTFVSNLSRSPFPMSRMKVFLLELYDY